MILKMIVLCFTFEILATAAPVERPLPLYIRGENPNYRVLRDHREADLFYLVPKRMVPVELGLSPAGNPEPECEAYELYQRAQKRLIEERLRLLDRLGSPEEGALVQRIEGLAASLATFEDKLVQPVGAAVMQWRLPQTPEDASLELGFLPTERTRFPDLAGLRLFPDNGERRLLPSPLQKRAALTLYDAQWNVKAREVSSGNFGFSVLPPDLELMSLPETLQLRQPLSLFTYCELRRESAPGIPVRASYVLAEWRDRDVLRSDSWLVYSRRLSEAGWAIVENLPRAETASAAGADPGAPALYSGAGEYQAGVFELSIPIRKDRND